jgi:hypothetical protein
LQRADAATAYHSVPSVRMINIWRTIRGYILWSHERGTIQYDVMVTLILLFIFLSPLWVNFKDKPVERNPHQTGVVVIPDSGGGLIYQIEASAVAAKDKDQAVVKEQLLRIIEPISGEVSITKVETQHDSAGRVLSYKVWVER